MTVRRLAKRLLPKKRRPDPQAFFVAGGIVVSLLLFAFVLQRVVPGERAIVEKLPPPAFGEFLPAGAKATGTPLEITELPQSSYASAYISGRETGIVLVEWDRDRGRYEGRGTAPFAGNVAAESVATLSLQHTGTGEDLIVVRAPSGAYADAVFVFVRGPLGLATARLVEIDGSTAQATFPSGASAQHTEEFSFSDLDGDGTVEAISLSTDLSGDTMLVEARAYRWQDGAFVRDSALSELARISKSLFPEPPTQE